MVPQNARDALRRGTRGVTSNLAQEWSPVVEGAPIENVVNRRQREGLVREMPVLHPRALTSAPERRAVTSISILIAGSTMPQTIAVAAGRTSPRNSPKIGPACWK